MKSSPSLMSARIRELAVEADVDPRSIQKVLRGYKVRGMAGRRAREALARAGLLQAFSSEGAIVAADPTQDGTHLNVLG
jgi:hypothetical protein